MKDIQNPTYHNFILDAAGRELVGGNMVLVFCGGDPVKAKAHRAELQRGWMLVYEDGREVEFHPSDWMSRFTVRIE